MIGYMPMPADFRYKDLFYAGRPVHQKYDDFWCRHPNMDLSRRAKIFAPFDALKGFSDAVSSKRIQYEEKREQSTQQTELLEEQLAHLACMTENSRKAKENSVIVEVEYFVPCTDPNHAAYGFKGRYETCSGIVWRVDYINRLLYVSSKEISLDDIYSIRTADQTA